MRSLESRRAATNESRPRLGNTVGEGEFEAGRQKLLDVRPANISGLLNLSYTENLKIV